MPTTKWTILTYQITVTATGCEIVITTDIACHLWMRYTLIKPKEHMIPVTRRGVTAYQDKYFCFDVWHDNEQEEAGDTLTHTFIKEPWPHCETRYFYFHGTIGAVASVSTTAIFEYHRVTPPWGPPQTHEYPSVVADGYLATWRGAPGATYMENWLSDGFWAGDAEATLTLLNNNYGVTFSVYRGVLMFNTAALPAGCWITAAKVRLYPAVMWNTRSAILNLTPATHVHSPLQVADFSALRLTPEKIGAYPMDDIIINNTFWIDLTAGGLAYITKAGETRLGLRIGFEIDANGAPVNEGFRPRTANQAPVGTQCILSVTYRMPL